MKIGFSRWIALLLGVLSVGCAGSGKKKIVIAPEYQPEYAAVFDDWLAPELFGSNPDGRDATADPKLRERTLRSDAILPVRVETVSRVGGVEKKGSYELDLAVAGPPLFGNASGTITVNIGAGSPSYPWVEGAGPRWVGTRFILFAKRFRTGKRNEPDVIHYRGEEDSQPMRAAIHRHLADRVLPVQGSPGE